MRKGLILLSVFVLLVGAYGLSWAGVDGSKHDFGTADALGSLAVGYGGDLTGQICRACHVPHRTLATKDMASAGLFWSKYLLWRQTSGARTGFVLWGTMDYWYTGWRTGANTAADRPGTWDNLDYASKGCLGCHDGGTFYLWETHTAGINYTEVRITRTGAKKVDLTEDHPVGIKYDPAYAVGGEIRTKESAEGYGIVFADGTKLGCGSCHDPHNKVASVTNFVRVTMSNSSLCLACHIK